MHFDKFGNPIKTLHPLTREVINDFIVQFENTRYAKRGSEIRYNLENELLHYKPASSYIRKVEHDGRYGVHHDLLGVELIPAIYDELTQACSIIENPIYIARQGNKYGIVKADGLGTIAFPFICDSISPCPEIIDKFIYHSNGKVGLIAECGHKCVEELPAIYDNIEPCPRTPYMLLSKDGKVGLHGTIQPIPTIYDNIYVPPHLGWIKVKRQGQWGYIDSRGQFTDDIGQAFLMHSTCALVP